LADSAPTILITGAAGNLGSLLARHRAQGGHKLRLMYHQKPLAPDLVSATDVFPVQADLAKPETLPPAVDGADVIVHFAGVLFAPRPERFLPVTNTQWFSITIGRVSHGGDTKRARQELISELKYRTLEDGLTTL
jgi:uncharacterized protein YbjT (DUF2867 family)